MHFNRAIDIQLLQVIFSVPPDFFQSLPKGAELPTFGSRDGGVLLDTPRNVQCTSTLTKSLEIFETKTISAASHPHHNNMNERPRAFMSTAD